MIPRPNIPRTLKIIRTTTMYVVITVKLCTYVPIPTYVHITQQIGTYLKGLSNEF
jgi:hypothetical protein